MHTNQEVKKARQKVSVILPIHNEFKNIEELVIRIDAVFSHAPYQYDIIAVDDYSTDESYRMLKSLAQIYPIKIVKKIGQIGKGSSIVEGLEHAHGEMIVIMDADLSYAPEHLPEMLAKLETCDIVVGTRIYMNGEKKIKKLFAKFSRVFFGRVMFGLDYDVQSGLKVFHRKIIHSITLNPTKWSFDLEFLYKADQAGYKIEGYDITYGSRKYGVDKMNPFLALIELFVMAVRFRFFAAQPIYIKSETAAHHEIGWKSKRFMPYTTLGLENSAIRTLSASQILTGLTLIFIIISLFILSWKSTLIGIVSVLTLIYFSDLLFNLLLISKSLRHSPEITVPEPELQVKRVWPMYTIICPLYKEWEVIPQFADAIRKMDYPKDKLEVMLVLEEDDTVTQAKAAKLNLPDYFQILVTPHAFPKTKPKACNFALHHANGEYIVIYDAEDIPDPLQLKKAVVTFEKYKDENVVCLQAKLNFYNVSQNLLTRIFTLEYSLWFDLILTGLHAIGAPIPLGGTSNHFRKSSLKLLKGWDPFNVTEDCDLGIRLFKYGYQTKILNSTTLEEANSSFWGWFPQRTRWMKGYIQTYLVHMRRPHDFITDWSNPHLLTFQLVVGGKILSTLVNPLLWALTLTYFIFRASTASFIESLFLDPIYYVAVISLAVGNFLYFYYYMIGAAKKGYWSLVKFAYLVPFYWIMMSVASWRAFHQVIFKPHYWEKTKHGLHLKPATA